MPALTDGPQNSPPGWQKPLVLEDVHVQFGKRKPVRALDGISLVVDRGEVLCLLGPNGAGKTTIVNTITGLVRPAAGRVAVFGYSPAEGRRGVLSRLSLVPQETALYEDLTARENLRFHGEFYGVSRRTLALRIDEALGLVGLTDSQYDRVHTFSGGMRRRLALGRALLTAAPLVLLDEPTLGVDVQSRNAIWERIRWLAEQGTAVLVTTNYMDEAEYLADSILIIDGGKVVAGGDPARLKREVGNMKFGLTFSNTGDAAAAAELIYGDWEALVDGQRVTISVSRSADVARLLQALPQEMGAVFGSVETLELGEPSLQDVFLHYTGRSLRS